MTTKNKNNKSFKNHKIFDKFILLELSTVSTIIYRVLPSMKYNLKSFRYLYTDKQIKSYFKGVRILQEYPGLFDLFRAYGFDMTLADEVRNSISDTKTTFFENIKESVKIFSSPNRNLKLCNIKQKHLDFITFRMGLDLFPGFSLESLKSTFRAPSFDEVISSVNLSASQGLPNPFLKKRDVLNNLKYQLRLFLAGKLSFNRIFSYPSAVFLRSQIRETGLKFRIVHAVQASQQVIESFYYLYFKSGLPFNSAVTIGKTQPEIAKLVSRYDDYYTYSIDHSKWDITRQPVLSVIAFQILLSVLPLTGYQQKILKVCRNYYLTLPTFHPTIELKRRVIGTVSGSGFTSLDNSLCNWILTCILIYNYCEREGLDPYQFNFIINVSGDDLIIGTKVPIKIDSIFKNSEDQFGASMKLECDFSPPGKSDCFFLGSNWIKRKPYRPEKVLVASVIFGSGNFPKMTTNELFQSRFFEVFGNSSNCLYYWKRFRMTPLKRLFFFNELFRPFKFGSSFSDRHSTLVTDISKISKDSRGFWYDPKLSHDVISSLWETR